MAGRRLRPAATRPEARRPPRATAPRCSATRASQAEVIELVPGPRFVRGPPARVGRDHRAAAVLLSHLDVVPVDAEAWSRDPFGGELIDGVVWGRGAVDMKDMVAMELGVMLALQRSGADLRRDVIFAAVADEEAGGEHGARGLVDNGPSSSVTRTVGRRPPPSTRSAATRSRSTAGASTRSRWPRRASSGRGSAATGTPGHGSMPHDDNADDQAGRGGHGARQRPGRPASARLHAGGRRLPEPLSASGDVARLAETDPVARPRPCGRVARPGARAARSTRCCATRSRRRCFTRARR